jgi:hypothetical protein
MVSPLEDRYRNRCRDRYRYRDRQKMPDDTKRRHRQRQMDRMPRMLSQLGDMGSQSREDQIFIGQESEISIPIPIAISMKRQEA